MAGQVDVGFPSGFRLNEPEQGVIKKAGSSPKLFHISEKPKYETVFDHSRKGSRILANAAWAYAGVPMFPFWAILSIAVSLG